MRGSQPHDNGGRHNFASNILEHMVRMLLAALRECKTS